MLRKKVLILFFSWICCHFLLAQEPVFDKEIKQIEHLAEYNQYDVAEKKADSLLLLLEKKYNDKKHLEYKLRLLLVKGRMYDIKEENNKALEVLLKAVDEAEKNKLYKIACHTNIILALVYEKNENQKLAKQYLDAADRIRKKHQLEEFYSTILVRRSLYHRWFTKNIDSAMYNTKKALVYAKKYNNEYDIMEASVMIGIYENIRKNYSESVKYFPTAVKYYLKTNNYNDATMMYYNIAFVYDNMKDIKKAKIYNDSAYTLSKKTGVIYQRHMAEQRNMIFEKMNNLDSAYYYLKISRDLREKEVKEDEAAAIKNITEKYDNDKKETVIKNKNQQMILISSLFGVIALGSVLLFRNNRIINKQNKTINRQVIDLTKTLEQKQVLLSELQHRVKNNLQHVISILEIQKESVDFNNIDELIRGNQNRIHSMALLHTKLNVNENANDIDLKKYVSDLSELVKDSYHSNKKQILLNIKCEIEKISIEKALPLGLIITELLSNSMKHAFKKQNVGIINIEITKSENKNKLYYSDNGSGFDFNKKSEKGLGQEIIKGLIDQLNGTFDTNQTNGFEIEIQF